MIVTKQFKITKVMSGKSRRSNFSQNSTLKMVLCQFCLVQVQFIAIFVAVFGLTITATPASAFSFKTDDLIKKSSLNPLSENDPSFNLELPWAQTKSTNNEATDELNLNEVRPYHLDKQVILAGKDTNSNQVSQLLQKAESNIQQITQAAQVSNEAVDGKVYYKYYVEDTKSKTKETLTYTNTWKAPTLPPKRKIPEPSTILGLIAIASLFVTQHQKTKIS